MTVAKTATRRALTDRQREFRSAANAAIKVDRAQEASRTRLIREQTAGRMQAERNRTREIASRQSIYLKEERDLASQRENRALRDQFTSPAKPAINGVLLVLFTMAGLIIVYALVTNPQPTSSFFGRLGDQLATLSSNAPLFEKATAPTPPGGGFSGGSSGSSSGNTGGAGGGF